MSRCFRQKATKLADLPSACQHTVDVAKQGRLCTTSLNASLSFLQQYQDVLQLDGQAEMHQNSEPGNAQILMHFGPTSKLISH